MGWIINNAWELKKQEMKSLCEAVKKTMSLHCSITEKGYLTALCEVMGFSCENRNTDLFYFYL